MDVVTLYRFDAPRTPLPVTEDVESGYAKAIMDVPALPERTPVEEVLLKAWGRLTACGLAL